MDTFFPLLYTCFIDSRSVLCSFTSAFKRLLLQALLPLLLLSRNSDVKDDKLKCVEHMRIAYEKHVWQRLWVCECVCVCDWDGFAHFTRIIQYTFCSLTCSVVVSVFFHFFYTSSHLSNTNFLLNGFISCAWDWNGIKSANITNEMQKK